MKSFKSGKDYAFEKYGAARKNNRQEFEKFLQLVESKGGVISWREKWLAYSPSKNEPGRLILDKNASMASLRHELKHLLDDEANGYPGLGWYLQHPLEYWRMEFSGYLVELSFFREQKDFDLGKEVLQKIEGEEKRPTWILSHE
jgi:hypothetical protein